MRRVVFYSWQSDLPNATNRGFIQRALEVAAAAIVADETVAIEPVVDRDTQGVPGSPDIATTIFAKIVAADVFVADVSIVSRPGNSRPSPNPNVLIELGYALRNLGFERVIFVFNEAFGRIDELPFDLRSRRITVYSMEAAATARAPERNELTRKLEVALRDALQRAPAAPPPVILALDAIENDRVNKVVVLRRNLGKILERLDALRPKMYRDGGTADELIAGIDMTQDVVAEFAKIAELIATMNDSTCATEVHRWFGQILERYDPPLNASGQGSNADGDFFRFIGHEMFVTLFSFLLRESRWETVERLLGERIAVGALGRDRGPANVTFDYVSQDLPQLVDEGRARKRMSVQADILSARHSTGGLAGVLPLNEFAATEVFLALKQGKNNFGYALEWTPRSTLYIKTLPAFVRDSEERQTAARIAKALSLQSLDEFKDQLRRVPKKGINESALWPIRPDDIERLGTR
jgi:hypothetical protein